MTTVYKFKAYFTKEGAGTAPSSAPTVTIVDTDNTVLVNAQAATALSNLTGAYIYEYSGADGLDLIGKFSTTDATMDAQDLGVVAEYTPVDVWSYVTRTITSGTITVANIWDALLTGITTTGSVGKLIKDYLDAAVSSRLSTAGYTAPDNASITAIKAKTDNLPSDPADQSLIDAAIDALPTAAEIDTQLSGTHGAGSWLSGSGGGGGSGAISTTVTITVNGLPRDGVEVWYTTDAGGLNVVASGVTDAMGQVTFLLDAGTYYVWKQLSGVNFTNPETTVVS